MRGKIGNENLKKIENHKKREEKNTIWSNMVLIGNVEGELLIVLSFIYSVTHSLYKYSIHGRGMRGRWHRGKAKALGSGVPTLVPGAFHGLLWVILRTEFPRLQNGNTI